MIVGKPDLMSEARKVRIFHVLAIQSGSSSPTRQTRLFRVDVLTLNSPCDTQ
jgi:hypothetical protein